MPEPGSYCSRARARTTESVTTLWGRKSRGRARFAEERKYFRHFAYFRTSLTSVRHFRTSLRVLPSLRVLSLRLHTHQGFARFFLKRRFPRFFIVFVGVSCTLAVAASFWPSEIAPVAPALGGCIRPA